MANMTGDEVVRRTRDLLMLFGDADAFRDGFSDDADTEPTSILAGVNEFLSLLQPTGIRVGDTTINTVSGTATYSISQEVGEIFSLRYVNDPLRPFTRRAWDDRKPDWYATAAGTPSHYCREGSQITLWPKPNAIAVVTINSTLPIPPITAHSSTNGVILHIPEHLQRFVPFGAASILAHIDAENKTHLMRREEYRRYATYLIMELTRISRGQDFARTPSFDLFRLPMQTEQESSAGRFGQGIDSYAPIGLPTMQGGQE